MEYRPFGQTDLQVSAIGFGCWEMGGTYGKIDEAQLQQAVQRAIDAGINCFDTAEAYGMGTSEQALARALGARRKEVSIVTKFGVGYEEAPNRRDSSRQRVMASIETESAESPDGLCRRLSGPLAGCARRPSRRPCARSTTLSSRARRATSACPISAWRSSKPVCSCDGWMWCSMAGTCSTGACRRRSSRIVPRSRLASWPMGHWPMACSLAPSTPACSLTTTIGAPVAGQMGVLNLFRTLFGPDDFPRNLRAVEELKALAAEYHKTLPQFALRWTTSHPVISVALVGCRQASEVEENLGALGWAISEADMAAIDAIFARHNAVTMPAGWLEDA